MNLEFPHDADLYPDYGPTLYKSLGFGTVQQLVMAAGWVSIAPFGNWFNAAVVDRLGRVKMLGKLQIPDDNMPRLTYA